MSANSVFQSLLCCVCHLPYIAQPDKRRNPRKLLCGASMCFGCYREELSKLLTDRKHKCSQGYYCLSNPAEAHFIIDILSDPSLYCGERGYQIYGNFKPLRCPLCCFNYTLKWRGKTPARPPRDLNCNHCLCERCYIMRRSRSQRFAGKYEVTCPTCNKTSYIRFREPNKNALHAFIDELPMMTTEHEIRQSTDYQINQLTPAETEVIYKMVRANLPRALTFQAARLPVLQGVYSPDEDTQSTSSPLTSDMSFENLVEWNRVLPQKHREEVLNVLNRTSTDLIEEFGTKITLIPKALDKSSTLAQAAKAHDLLRAFMLEYTFASKRTAGNLSVFIEEMKSLLTRFDAKFACFFNE